MRKVTIIKLIWYNVIEATCQAWKLILKNPREKRGGVGNRHFIATYS